MRTICLALLIPAVGLYAAAQQSSSSQPDTTPAPAFDQAAPILNPENPPVSGLDEPSLELRTVTRSFVSPALQVSESVDTNGGNQLGQTGLGSVSHVLGALDLQQFWSKSDLFLEYLGGGAFYASPYDAKQLQAVGLEAVTRWRTGQATLRDSFSYLPDGSFQIGYGGVPGFGLAKGGFGMPGGALPGSQAINGGTLGSVGNIPRLANTAILDAVQALNPVSAITVAGGFSNAHFYDSANCSIPTNICLINSDELTIEGGYSHLVSRHDQFGVVYAFQLFQFPQDTGGQFYNDIVNLRWKYSLSGRMSLIAGAGPEYIIFEERSHLDRWSLSARVVLNYKFAHSSMSASYEKFTSAGSGFFTGANTQVARLLYDRPIGRTWEFYGNLAYSNNKEVMAAGNFGAAGASSYNAGSAGGVLRKHLGRTYDFFVSYRFSEMAFDGTVCLTASTCGRTAQRQIGTIGMEWHPTPTRIE